MRKTPFFAAMLFVFSASAAAPASAGELLSNIKCDRNAASIGQIKLELLGDRKIQVTDEETAIIYASFDDPFPVVTYAGKRLSTFTPEGRMTADKYGPIVSNALQKCGLH